MVMIRLMSVLLAAALVIGAPHVVAQSGPSTRVARSGQGSDLFQKALSKERAEGRLDQAIEIYERIVKEFSADRPIAAKALLQLGRCYERLGKADARTMYDRVLREYADQRAVADEARARLTAFARPNVGRGGNAPATGPAARRLWEGQAAGQFLGSPSPDGRYMSFVDWTTLDLALFEMASGTPGTQRPLTTNGKEAGGTPYWSRFSPDGTQVVFTFFGSDGSGDLRIVRVDDPAVRVLYRNNQVGYVQPFDWSPDGRHVLVLLNMPDRTNRIAVVSVADGSARVLKTLDWRQPLAMNFSLDGRWIVYDLPQRDETPERDLFLLATDGSRETRLVEHPADDFLLGWARDGKTVLFASDRTGTPGVWAVEVAAGRAVGAPRFIRGDVGWRVHPMGFSRAGAFFYFVENAMSDVYTATLDPGSAGSTDVVSLGGRYVGMYESADWSPDGRQLAVVVNQIGLPERRLLIRRVDQGDSRELRPDLSMFTWPRWSPDGRSILVSGRDRKNRAGLFSIDPATGAVAALIRQDSGGQIVLRAEWAADGQSLFYTRKNASCTCVVRRDLTSGQDIEIDRMPTSGTTVILAPSPDGRWLAVSTRDASRPFLKVIPAAGGEGRVIADGETLRWFNFVAWTPDAREVLFGRQTGPDGTVELWRVPAGGGEARRAGLSMLDLRNLRLHPDGRRVVFTSGQNKGELWVMENFLPAAQTAAKSR